jgi:hypothetical protein
MESFKLELLGILEGEDDRLEDIALRLTDPDRLYTQKSTRKEGYAWIIDSPDERDLIRIEPFDGGKAGWGVISYVSCSDIERSEFLRFQIAEVLKTGFHAKEVYLLRDDVSMKYALELYPRLNEIENRLRNYLIRFFLPLFGDDWLLETTSPETHNKISSRKFHSHKKWHHLINLDLSYMDFRELGELITSNSAGNSDISELVGKIIDLNSMEEVAKLKNELESNYFRYFKETFQSHRFHKIWPELAALRHKVAHNGFLKLENVQKLDKLEDAFSKMMKEAELRLKEFKPVPHNLLVNENTLVSPEEPTLEEEENKYADLLPKLKILGKIELPKKKNVQVERRVIDDSDPFEEEFEIEEDEFTEALREYLEECQRRNAKFLAYDTLRYNLRDEGYSWDSVTKMTQIFYKLGKVELYQYQDEFSYKSTTAIRFIGDD